MSLHKLIEVYQFVWMLQSHREQRLAWKDAAEARVARARAEELSSARLEAMLDANPSGQLGNAQLNDLEKLRESGLL